MKARRCFVVPRALGGDRSAVAIASDDVNHLVLYRDVRAGGTRLFVTHASSSGVVLDSPGPPLGDASCSSGKTRAPT